MKPAAGPGLTFDKQSHKDDVCVSVTLTGKKEKKTPSLFTLSSHIWDCNALSWLHKYTPGVCGFLKNVEEQVKASLPRCKAKTPRGMRRKNRSRVVNKERIFFFELPALVL